MIELAIVHHWCMHFCSLHSCGVEKACDGVQQRHLVLECHGPRRFYSKPSLYPCHPLALKWLQTRHGGAGPEDSWQVWSFTEVLLWKLKLFQNVSMCTTLFRIQQWDLPCPGWPSIWYHQSADATWGHKGLIRSLVDLSIQLRWIRIIALNFHPLVTVWPF